MYLFLAINLPVKLLIVVVVEGSLRNATSRDTYEGVLWF